MPLTFDTPPITEVVFGQVFAQRPDFLIPHFGDFWARIKDAYPSVEHATILVDDGGEPIFDTGAGTFLPRVWFRSDDRSQLVQLQQDRIYVNWRQIEGREVEYPRYPALKAEFDRVVSIFEKYIQETIGQAIQHTRLELTYINIIDIESLPVNGPAQFDFILRDCVWRPNISRYLPEPRSYASRLEFQVDEDINLIVQSGSAKRSSSGKKVLRLEITARQMSSDNLDRSRDDWFDLAHQRVVQSFKDLTTDQMHKDHWHLREEK